MFQSCGEATELTQSPVDGRGLVGGQQLGRNSRNRAMGGGGGIESTALYAKAASTST